MNLELLQQTVEELEEWERVACERIRQQRTLPLHEIDARIAHIEKLIADRIGRAIQQAVR